ncbi:hypothetical protein H6F67_10940 [Microcoleus sp. FACHB-1515]|uniref:hypothetical protein n=1 Tax=Cyanophyceae TaxID=3028117 RepID=UPI001684BF94|nr:hypothetical protein [Microcoleus sp. FACHB-1515]MBD2090370.1 hypothetical protein [Microcoleus sp. FACHB-1515]
MSWTSSGFFRNTNILNRLTAATGTNPIEVYKPGTLSPQSIASGVRYSGFITSLRLNVDIRSISEFDYPVPGEDQSEGEVAAAVRDSESSSAKKQLNLLMRRDGADAVKVASLWLYNRRPYYSVDLLLYFTDAAAFDVASDTAILLQVESIGFGVLEGQDAIVIHGSAVEEGENTAPSLNVNVFANQADILNYRQAITDGDGSPITNAQGEIIVNA